MYKHPEVKPKVNYMQELDTWLDELLTDKMIGAYTEIVVNANANARQDEVYTQFDGVYQEIKKALKAKMLESFHNGKKAAGVKPFLRQRQV